MDYALTLCIDGHPPALNGEQGLIRLHYRSYAQKRTEWETLILAALPADVRAFFQDHHFVECEVWYLHRNKKGLDWDKWGIPVSGEQKNSPHFWDALGAKNRIDTYYEYCYSICR